MIFKQVNEKVDIDPNYEIAAETFSFEDIIELIYPDNENDFINLQTKVDKRLYPDLIAAIYRKMYENGLARRVSFRDAILACSYHLQLKNFKFLGFIRKEEEVTSKAPGVDFVTRWDFDGQQYYIRGLDEKKLSIETLDAIFEVDDFERAYNVFFIAGCQSFEMLDLRIKKAANLIIELINNKFLKLDELKIILSGWNNAKIFNSKVQFANESLAMRNMLIHKLIHHLNIELSDDFINYQIDSDINSKDTNENIEELMKKLEEVFLKAVLANKTKFNLFVVSSSFHLLQLSDSIQAKRNLLSDRLGHHPLELNIFLVGSENPDHFFKIYDGHYIKLLMNEVVHRSFKFCRKKENGNSR